MALTQVVNASNSMCAHWIARFDLARASSLDRRVMRGLLRLVDQVSGLTSAVNDRLFRVFKSDFNLTSSWELPYGREQSMHAGCCFYFRLDGNSTLCNLCRSFNDWVAERPRLLVRPRCLQSIRRWPGFEYLEVLPRQISLQRRCETET